MSNRRGKKGVCMATPEFARVFDQISKAALIDALWCACQLGTNETPEEILTQAARNAVIALNQRGDRLPATMASLAHGHIDADGVTPSWPNPRTRTVSNE
jgi:hypothetical protein